MSLNRALKGALAERRAVLVPGAYDALSARVAADLGFEVLYVTGAGVTNARLGQPDVGLITLTELASTVAAMREVVDLPLIVDADTGFGNAINVRRTVRALERAGANAIQLEDQVSPKRCGHFAGKDVVAADEMVQKVRAAVDARHDPDLVIVARTDARATLGLDEALGRAQRYLDAGADMTFVEAPQGLEEIREIPRRLAAPQLVNMVIGGRTPFVPLEDLRAMGFSVVLYANAALQGAVHGMQQALRTLRDGGGLREGSGLVASFAERQRLVGKDEFDGLERRYATGRP